MSVLSDYCFIYCICLPVATFMDSITMTVWMAMTWHAASTDPLHYAICDANEREQKIYCVYAPLAAECSLLRLTCSRRNTHKVCSKFSKQLYGHLYENSCHKFACTYGKDNRPENTAHTPISTHLHIHNYNHAYLYLWRWAARRKS